MRDIATMKTYLSQGIILTSSKTFPVPSELRAHTGLLNCWKVRSQQSKGVCAWRCVACSFLSARCKYRRVGN